MTMNLNSVAVRINFDIYYIKYGTKTDEKLLFVFVLFIYQRILSY